MEVRPLGPDQLEALVALGRRPDVVRYGDHTPDAPDAWFEEWLGAPDPHQRLTVGAFSRGALHGAGRLTMSARRRQLHVASLDLLVPFEGAEDAARALASALSDVADRWLQVVRIAHHAPADHPYEHAVLAPLGFTREGVRRRAVERDGALADELLLARVRDGTPTSKAGPGFPLPARGDSLAASIRPTTKDDAAAMTEIFNDPRVAWGTLQVPMQRVGAWRERLERNDPAHIVSLAATVDGALAATGSLVIDQRTRRRHAGGIGMGVASAFQGRTVGRQLLDALLDAADERGLTRVELEVWEDNERAQRLYASRGFETEGVERAIGFREGAYVNDLAMARLQTAPLDE